MENTSMYAIREEHLSLLQAVEDAEGEVTLELEQALSFTKEQFEQKAVSYGYVIKHFDDNTAAIDKEIERLAALKEKASKRKEWLKQLLSDAMLEFGYEKINTPTLSLSFIKSKSVEITDEKLLPEPYKIHTVSIKPDKKLIKQTIEMGLSVPGAKLITKQNLQIK